MNDSEMASPAEPATVDAGKPKTKPKRKTKPVKAAAKPKRKAARKTAKAKPAAAKRRSPKGAGRVPGQHIMSVHIDLKVMSKLDKMIASNRRTGKGPTSRSAAAVAGIERILSRR